MVEIYLVMVEQLYYLMIDMVSGAFWVNLGAYYGRW